MYARKYLVRALAVLALLIAAHVALAPAAAAQLPTEPAEAVRVFENEAGAEEWADGPVQYLFTKEEHDIWDDLETDEERRDFRNWFWERRDPDLRDRRHPFLEDFYTRVATANERFSGFPRGWRSDRGRVWVTLGRPDGVSAGGLDTAVWSYSTYGGILRSSSFMGEMKVAFVQVEPSRWQIAGGVGPGAWPPYVLQAFDAVNRALIVNPDLEWKGSGLGGR